MIVNMALKGEAFNRNSQIVSLFFSVRPFMSFI